MICPRCKNKYYFTFKKSKVYCDNCIAEQIEVEVVDDGNR